jgi:hypothetical protein
VKENAKKTLRILESTSGKANSYQISCLLAPRASVADTVALRPVALLGEVGPGTDCCAELRQKQGAQEAKISNGAGSDAGYYGNQRPPQFSPTYTSEKPEEAATGHA